MRINKFLARCGLGSRRQVEHLIREGRVRINGQPATLGSRVREGDVVEVDGRVVHLPREVHLVVYHKPRGVLTTLHDPKAQGRTLREVLPPFLQSLRPVGRLDRDSEGLLLLTDHGDLLFHLTHPSFGVEKVYQVRYRGALPPSRVIRRFQQGLELEDGPFRPQAVQFRKGWVVLTLREGRKREIRRAFAALGLQVIRLVRLRMGPFALGSLPPGHGRLPTEAEWATLCRHFPDLDLPPHPASLPGPIRPKERGTP
jgi:pseudouridine synthase